VLHTGSLAHVGQEVDEVTPSLAHRDPAGSVTWIRGVARVCAAAPHRGPRGVGGRARQTVFVARRLLPGVRGQLDTGRFTVRPSSKSPRVAGPELSRAPRRVFPAAAPQLTLRRRRRLTFQRRADSLATLLGHVVAFTGAFSRALGHAESIDHHLNLFYAKAAA
jgi:hypothetical protein